MFTIYKKNMNSFNPMEVDNIFDTVNKCFIPLDERNNDYKRVLQYLADNNLTVDQLDIYE